MKKFVWPTLALIGLILIAFIFNDEFNRAGLLGSGGMIQDGNKFGFAIGMDKSDVAMRLTDTRFIELDGDHFAPRGSCHGHDFDSAEEEMMMWSDPSWRRGVLCFGFRNDKLTTMTWSYGGWQL